MRSIRIGMQEGISLVSEGREAENPPSNPTGPKKRLFLVCDFCYWSASALTTRRDEPFACPECHNPISSLPLSDNETYRFNHDARRGVEVDFSEKGKK